MVVVDSRRVPRVPRYSGTCHEPHCFHLRGYHPLWPVLPDCSVSRSVGNSPALNRAGPTTPMDPETHRFGLFRVRSPLLTESHSISVPRGTEMFQFPRCPPPSRAVPAYDRGGVAPFGNLRISACWRLPGAFRRLPRPSSAPSAKASTVCPYSLSQLPDHVLPAERSPTLCRQN